jgi:hypothetical protein
MLIQRFLMPIPKNLEGPAIDKFKSRRKIVRMRVFNCFRHWIETNWRDFVEDPELGSTLESFIQTRMSKALPDLAKQLALILERSVTNSSFFFF